MKQKILLTAACFFIIFFAKAQLIDFSPSFPTENDNITITYDAAKSSGTLKDCGCDIYLHTGVITDKSTSAADWKYVKHASFNTPFADVKFTALGNNKHQLVINNPRSFYGVPAGEKILKISMVFRNADGTKEGKNLDGSDAYLPIFDAGGFNVRFTNPAQQPKFDPVTETIALTIGQSISITGIASKAANLNLTLNGNLFGTAINTQTITATAIVVTSGPQEIKLSAVNAGNTVQQTLNFIVNSSVEIAPLPANAKDGVTFINNGTSAIFNLYAPGKNNIYLLGDFNNWQPVTAGFMKKTPDNNRWWIQIDNLNPDTEYAYQYLVNNSLKIADPYAEKILDPNNDGAINAVTYPNLKAYPAGKTTGIVSVIQGKKPVYNWQVNNFQRPKKTDLVIYELLVRDFVSAHNYQTLIDTLSYLQNLGVNAIELMPVNEFENNESWGYNGSFHFAADKYYGTQNKLKEFIDECHKRGIAVIADMVLNHAFGQNPMVQLYFANGQTTAESPWFNSVPTHPFNVGYDFNHESAATKYYVKNVMKYWMTEYKLDGFRFDLSKGFTQKNSGTGDNAVGPWSAYDASRVVIWKDYYDAIKEQDAGFFTILEHFADNQEEKELADYGMMFWGNMNYNYNEATMGYIASSNLSGGIYKVRNFTNPNLVTYMESHDEERLMYKNLQFGNVSNANGYSTKVLATALKRMELAAAFFFTIPGPKMIWQFGERGYDLSINFPSGTANDRLTNKPPRWDYMAEPDRKKLYDVYAKLIKLRVEQPVFETTDFSYNLTGAVKTINLNNNDLNVVVVGNFDVSNQTAAVTFPNAGRWYDYLTKDSISVTSTSYNYALAAGEYHVLTSKNLNPPLPDTTTVVDTVKKEATYFFGYPNPVKTQTTFVYSLTEASDVSLKIYDLQGKLVTKLLENKQPAGNYEINWQPLLSLGNGIYIARLTKANSMEQFKIIINR